MQFQIIKDEYYFTILQRMETHIPEFKSVFDKEDGIYPILGELGTYLIENVNIESTFNKGIQFLEEAVCEGGGDTEDVIVQQIFQKFYESKKLSGKIRNKLKRKTKLIFDKYFLV